MTTLFISPRSLPEIDARAVAFAKALMGNFRWNRTFLENSSENIALDSLGA